MPTGHVVTTADRVKSAPLGRIVSWGMVGVKPEIMGIGPKEAIPRALKQVGLKPVVVHGAGLLLARMTGAPTDDAP